MGYMSTAFESLMPTLENIDVEFTFELIIYTILKKFE